jgi:hypothetical protein
LDSPLSEQFGADTAAHVRDTWFYPGYDNCFEGRKYNTCPDNVKVSLMGRCVESTACTVHIRAFLLTLPVVATRQGVDPGFDPLLNHMNYVYTQCQFQKGHFTDGQMITMVSKFGTCPAWRSRSSRKCTG